VQTTSTSTGTVPIFQNRLRELHKRKSIQPLCAGCIALGYGYWIILNYYGTDEDLLVKLATNSHNIKNEIMRSSSSVGKRKETACCYPDCWQCFSV